MSKLFKFTFVALGFIAVATSGFLAAFTHDEAIKLVTHPKEEREAIAETPADRGMSYENVTVTTSDGLELAGWFVPSTNGATVMAQHGYKSDRQGMLEEAEILHRRGYGILLMSVRAHDESDGEMIYFGQREMADFEAWYQYLLSRGDVDPDRIGIIGNSMGASLVIQYAAQNENLKAVVAHSPFATMDGTVCIAVKKFTGFTCFPIGRMIVYWAERETGIETSDVDATAWIAEISPRPILIMQAGLDDYVALDSGELLYEAAGEPKEFWFEPEIGHTDFDKELAAEFEKQVCGFFDQYLLQDDQTAVR